MVKHDNKASPPVKVVGFRVEGATPSPGESSLAEAAQANTSTGSPSPVIIPPAFAGQGRASGGDATPTMQPAPSPAGLAPGGGSFQLDLREGEDAGSGGLPPIRTEPQGLDPDAFARDRTPTKALVVSPTGRPLPLTPVGASAPADLGRQFAAAVGSPTSAPSSIPEQAAVVLAAATISAAIAPPPPASATLVRQQAAAALPEPPLAAAGRAAAAGPPAAAEGPARGGSGSGDGAPAPAPAARKGQKEMSKAERRAVQEAQRAAKAAAKAGQGGSGTAAAGSGPAGGKEQGKAITKQGSGSNLAQQGTVTRQPSGAQQDGKTTAESAAAARAARQQQGSNQGGGKAGASPRADVGVVVRAKSAEMFAHLPQPKGITLATVAEQKGPPVPLAAVKLGLRYADGSVRGGNARCIAMLQMVVECIQDFHTPPGREFAKEFAPALNNIINFLVSCRPLSVSMGNAIKSIKGWLEKMKVQPQPNEQQAKDVLVEQLTEYLEQKIGFADRMLVKHAIAKIKDGDTIMTYAYSSVVAATLLAAHRAGKQFDVVVVDSRPLLEGRRMLTTLLEAGVTCEYCHLGALSYEMTEVDKVFLGAASVLSNGAVLSRVGTAAVALMAAAQRVPVLVCCETYKFHERVQLDSITNNELMDKGGLAHVQDRPDVAPLQGWEQEDKVHLLNLAYDLTPADFVTVVVTEMGAVPPTSVAVILREAQRDIGMM